jgi:hypothetical protein
LKYLPPLKIHSKNLVPRTYQLQTTYQEINGSNQLDNAHPFELKLKIYLQLILCFRPDLAIKRNQLNFKPICFSLNFRGNKTGAPVVWQVILKRTGNVIRDKVLSDKALGLVKEQISNKKLTQNKLR